MLILATKSPRRIELLKTIYNGGFIIEPTEVDETKAVYDRPFDKALATADLKMRSALKKHPDDIILTADTVVVCDHEILEKPKDSDEAFRMLRQLSGRPHLVITGYLIAIKRRLVRRKSVTTALTLKAMDDEKIKKYILTGSPFDKAGAYGIQDSDFIEVGRMEGSYTNVMGLPTEELTQDFLKLGI